VKGKGLSIKFFEKHWLIVLFIITGIFLLSFFPRAAKFKYEYQKGKPWAHEVLIAPFDFPIYKTDDDLSREKDSIIKYFPAYFIYNPKIVKDKKDLLEKNFNQLWNQFVEDSPNPIPSSLKEEVHQKLLTILDRIYKNGILDIPEESEVYSRYSPTVNIVKNNVAQEVDRGNVFTLKQGYEYFKRELQNYNDELVFSKGIDLETFISNLQLTQYLTPNLFFDEVTTKKSRQNAIENISLTEGMVMAGERIIFTGDIVNAKTYKILESLKKEYEEKLGFSTNYFVIIVGQSIIVIFFLLLIYFYIRRYYPRILYTPNSAGFIFFIITLFAFIAMLIIRYRPAGIYMIPFAILAILLKTFYDSRLSEFLYVVTILLISFWAPNSFEFAFLNITAGIVAILSLSNIYRRNKMFLTSAWVIASYISVYIGISLYQEGNLKNLNTENLFYFLGNGILILSSLPLIYVFEKIFGFLSDATLMELSDTNQPLLRMLAEKAPGTFQHSLQVANLAEEAIYKIGGNPLLVRAGALYHDIGKMENPAYFIENLSEQANPHEALSLEESAKIIIGHVPKGVDIALHYRLPEAIIFFIRTHHGTTRAHYFYRSYIKMHPDTNIDLESFTYPGPKPFSREMAVIMMADSVEAASRSLKKYSEKDINQLVDTIIDNLMKEKQLNDTNVTLKDIEIVRNTFKKRLLNIYHARIEYPTIDK
jgi:putative nucleotidyltransferase with HDIG domain